MVRQEYLGQEADEYVDRVVEMTLVEEYVEHITETEDFADRDALVIQAQAELSEDALVALRLDLIDAGIITNDELQGEFPSVID